MSEYYNPKRTYNIFDPLKHDVSEPFKISRSKIDLFLDCPRCFYMDLRYGVGRPPGFPFNLNSAVDRLLKKEFDTHRAKGLRHPLMESYKIEAVPYDNPDIDKWRNTRQGISCLYSEANLTVYGAIDDVWINKDEELLIVDYKATSKSEEVSLDASWQSGYKIQMEVYQWLFRKNGFKVSDTGYFVYCNGNSDKEAFDARLEFDIKILPYVGDDSWVEAALQDIKECLKKDSIPGLSPTCDYCRYTETVRGLLKSVS